MNMLAVLFSFSGRIGRAQYWLGYFVQLALAALAGMCAVAGRETDNVLLLIAPIALFPIVLWMALAVMTKRYHDRDKSAWWILIAFIPIVGPIWQLIELGLLKGTEGTNDYGPDPCHNFNVGDDIEILRRQAGYPAAAQSDQAVAVAAAPRPRSPYNDGRPVFGKRV